MVIKRVVVNHVVWRQGELWAHQNGAIHHAIHSTLTMSMGVISSDNALADIFWREEGLCMDHLLLPIMLWREEEEEARIDCPCSQNSMVWFGLHRSSLFEEMIGK